jgi:hypothetical protein
MISQVVRCVMRLHPRATRAAQGGALPPWCDSALRASWDLVLRPPRTAHVAAVHVPVTATTSGRMCCYLQRPRL